MAVTAIALMPLGVGLAQQQVNPSRVLPDAVQGGETFDVTVTFSSPADNFNAVGLTDNASDGWEATVGETWGEANSRLVAISYRPSDRDQNRESGEKYN